MAKYTKLSFFFLKKAKYARLGLFGVISLIIIRLVAKNPNACITLFCFFLLSCERYN